MRSLLIAPFLALAFSFPVVAQDDGPAQQTSQRPERTPAQQEARKELNEAARSYVEGDFVAAQQHSEKALALDPANKVAPLFIARTIHAQYKPGDRSEANIAKAREGIEAYKRILLRDAQNEEAYKAIAYLYAATKEDELLRQWIFQRANDATVSAAKRAEAFVVLASRDWDCAFKITELPANKITNLEEHAVEIQYVKPKDPVEFEKARQCADDGLELVENAIALDADNEAAWSYKTSLLLESSKLAEMDNQPGLKAKYQKQYSAAQSTLFALSKRRENSATPKP